MWKDKGNAGNDGCRQQGPYLTLSNVVKSRKGRQYKILYKCYRKTRRMKSSFGLYFLPGKGMSVMAGKYLTLQDRKTVAKMYRKEPRVLDIAIKIGSSCDHLRGAAPGRGQAQQHRRAGGQDRQVHRPQRQRQVHGGHFCSPRRDRLGQPSKLAAHKNHAIQRMA